MTEAGDITRKVLVWDAPTRLFHWLVVALVAAAYVTWRLNWMNWHALVGDALLVLLFFRLLWGVLGSETARFSRFLVSPRNAARASPGRSVMRRTAKPATTRRVAGWWFSSLPCCSAGR